MRFVHRGLRRFHERGDDQMLDSEQVARIRRILTVLRNAETPRDVQEAGWRIHPLRGNRRGQWSGRVSGNWRIVFRFQDGEAVDIDLIDYH